MINIAITQHAVAFPTKTLAAVGGKHIYNIRLDLSDADNGNFVAKGDFVELDLYKQAAATTFEGKVVAQAVNGNYYVEVTDPGDALFVYNPAIIEEEYSSKFTAESNFYNGKGEVVRGYELAVGDIVEISDAGFDATPTVGATVTLSGMKLA